MRVSFGSYTLDSSLRELHDGTTAVQVEPQVFDLIEFLIKHRNKVVSRDDLIESIWNGRIVSESTMATRINAARRAIGDDGAAQKLIKTVARKGFRFIGDVREEAATFAQGAPATPSQKVSFCKTGDGVNIAVATVGEGPALVKTANWLNHIENDWQSPIWAPMLQRLASRFKVSRYDGRGTGVSDREVADISFAGFERDLDAVVNKLALEKFTLLGMSQGASTAITYSVRHPERVSKLILYGAYAQGRNRRASPDEAVTAQTVLAMMRAGWGQEDSAFMRAFASLYLPNGTREQIREFAELQRKSTSAEMAARLRIACDDIDVAEFLPRVKVPTLVLHARRDQVVPVEEGRSIAAAISGARFVTLESENHVPLPGEGAWEQLLSEIEAFAGN